MGSLPNVVPGVLVLKVTGLRSVTGTRTVTDPKSVTVSRAVTGASSVTGVRSVIGTEVTKQKSLRKCMKSFNVHFK